VATFFQCGTQSGRISISSLSGCGGAIREASLDIESYSPQLDRDLRASGLVEVCAAGVHLNRAVYVGGDALDVLSHLSGMGNEVRVLYLGLDGLSPLRIGRELGEGRVTCLGSREYSKEQRDELRRTQRLLPSFELDWAVAVKTATLEVGEAPVLVSLNLNLFDLGSVPDALGATSQGLRPKEFFESLEFFPGSRTVAFHLWGGAEQMSPCGRTSRLGAEILREVILGWWG
jgi:hypothetical protein